MIAGQITRLTNPRNGFRRRPAAHAAHRAIAIFLAAILLLGPTTELARAQSGADDICATSSDPATCEQMVNQAISQGGMPGGLAGQIPGLSGSGGGIQGVLQGLTQSQNSGGAAQGGPAPSVTVSPTQLASKRPQQTSRLEQIYSQRAGMPLTQFGYDLVSNGGTVSALQIGAIQDDYILGQGDTIIVTLRGQENATYNVLVDRDGNVTLPRLRPISALGRRFGDFRANLDAAVKQGYIQTQAYVTIGQVRQITVSVVGEVVNPGVFALSGLSTVLDALNLAGGIKKSGSLRNIVVVRNGSTVGVDLYRLVSPEGKTPDVTLRQGDRIVVVPLGPTIAVAGEVRRPGIYELRPGERDAPAAALIRLANGYTIRGSYRVIVVRTRSDGTQNYEDDTVHMGAALRDGEILAVNPAANLTTGNVTLAGNARLPGVYALDSARTLRELLPSADAFLPVTYMPFGFIVRQDRKTLLRILIPFSVQQLIDGKFNLDLQSQDTVHILTFNAMRQIVALHVSPYQARKDIELQNGNQNSNVPGFQQGFQQNGLPQLPTGAVSLNNPAQQLQGGGQQGGANMLAAGVLQALAAQFGGAQPGIGAFAGQAASNGQTSATSTTQGANGTSNAPLTGAASISAASQAAQAGVSGGAGATGNTSGASGATISGATGAEQGAVEGLTAEESATVGFVASDYRVTLEGGVRQPGDYLAAPGTTLAEIINAANGLQPEADLNSVEITSLSLDNLAGRSQSTRKIYALTADKLASITLDRLDVVHIPSIPIDQEDGVVTLAGEVQFPGDYHILKGEHLSSLLARAGGLTKQAYPMGAVFQRSSVAQLQQNAHQREADDMQKQLVAAVAQGGNPFAAASGATASGGLSAEGAAFVEEVITQLRTKPADGRISVIADPVVLAANPAADIELQPGDTLSIPKHPSEVDVTGEVLNPGSFRYAEKLGVADYVSLSGGFDRYADDDHIFVVNPDGTSRGVSESLFNFEPTQLAPGSVIVVPRDLRPLDLGVLTVTVAKVLSDFAVSAASLAVISRSNN
jgi:protein involved in polysaccharide export with SLBB domain